MSAPRRGEVRIGNRRRGDEGIYVGRPSIFGNPFRVSEDHGRADVIAQYEEWLAVEMKRSTSPVVSALKQLALRVAYGGNITLVCWCWPKACHADVIRHQILRLAHDVHESD